MINEEIYKDHIRKEIRKMRRRRKDYDLHGFRASCEDGSRIFVEVNERGRIDIKVCGVIHRNIIELSTERAVDTLFKLKIKLYTIEV